MCLSKPKIPPPPPPPQEIKQPDSLSDMRSRRRASGMSGGTLLTSASGVSGVSTAGNTLLGG